MGRKTGVIYAITKEYIRKIKELDIIDAAFIAGFYEGEGTCALRYGTYPIIQIGQKNPEILERLKKLCGGRIHKQTTREYYIWVLGGKAASEFAFRIFPFLSEKRKIQLLTKKAVY